MEVQPKSPTTRGPAEWFTGDVWIDAVAQGHGPSPMSIGSVHFAPAARTAWHSHSIGQTLYVTKGEGRVQARGEPIATIRPGDVIHAPGGEWHWHGAAPDHFMTHLSMSEGDAEWGEHISDSEYDRSRGGIPRCRAVGKKMAVVTGASKGIEPGQVFDRIARLDEVPDGHKAMDEREAIKVLIEP